MELGENVQPEDNGGPQDGALPPPTTPQLELQSGPFTIVRSAADLTEAFRRQLLDIEIQEHLDLRGLEFAHNPTLTRKACRDSLGVPGGGCDFLFYLDTTRSVRVRPSSHCNVPVLHGSDIVQGNCSGPPDAHNAPQFVLPEATVNSIDRVAHGQCVIIIDRPTFQTVSGNKWFQNLYFLTVPSTEYPQLAPTAISVSPFQRESGMNLFLTRMTFHGAGPDELSRAVAVEPDVRDVDRNLGRLVNAPYRHSILVQESRFLNYGGTVPPVLISGESFGTFRNCSFENFQLPRELFDVSFGGMLQLDTCGFKNVSLLNAVPKLVSTTANNYISCAGDVVEQTVNITRTPQAIFFNYVDDDEDYDILSPQLTANNLTSGVIVNKATMSDCLRLSYACPRIATPIVGENYTSILPLTAPPGCPVSTIAHRAEMLQTRCQSDFFRSEEEPDEPMEVLQSQMAVSGEFNVVNGTLMPVTALTEADIRAALEAQVDQACLGYGNGGIQEARGDGFVYGFLEPDHPWLAAINRVLPEYPHNNAAFWSWPCSLYCPDEPTATATMDTPVVAERIANVTVSDMLETSNVVGIAVGSAVAGLVLAVVSILLYVFVLRKHRARRNTDCSPRGLHKEELPVSEAAGQYDYEGGGQSRAVSAPDSGRRSSDTRKSSLEWGKSGRMLNSPTDSSSCTSSRVQSVSLNFATPVDVQTTQNGSFYAPMDPHTDLEAGGTAWPRSKSSRLSIVAKDHHQLTKSASQPQLGSSTKQPMVPLATPVKVPEAPSPTASASSPSAPSWFKAFSRAPPPTAAPMMHLQSESLVSTENATENTTENTTSQPPEGFSRAYNGLPGDYFAVDMNSTMDSSMYDGKAKVLPLLSPAGPGQRSIVPTYLRPSTASPGATVYRCPEAALPARSSRQLPEMTSGSEMLDGADTDDPFVSDVPSTMQTVSRSLQLPAQEPSQSHNPKNNNNNSSSALANTSIAPAMASPFGMVNSTDLSTAQSDVNYTTALSTADAGIMDSQLRHNLPLPSAPNRGAAPTQAAVQLHQCSQSLSTPPTFLVPKAHIHSPPRSLQACPSAVTLAGGTAFEFHPAAAGGPVSSAHSSQMLTATSNSSQVSQIMQSFERAESGGSVGSRTPVGGTSPMSTQPSGALTASPMSRVQSGEASSAGHSHHLIMDHFESDYGATIPDYPSPRAAPSYPSQHGTAPAAASAVPASLAPMFRTLQPPASPLASSPNGRSHLNSNPNTVLAAASTGGSALDMLAGGDSAWYEAQAGQKLNALMSTLINQLDRFKPKHLIVGQYRLLGSHARKRGGQSVVQFAMGPNGKSEVAIKFFLDPTAFYTEAQLYSTFVPEHRGCVTRPACMDTIDPTETYDSSYRVESRQLHNEAPTLSLAVQGGKFLPQVEAIYDIGAEGLEDPSGQRLPPCIVMEKGESLEALLKRTAPNRLLILTILSNISKRIAAMHEEGYAHRDIKPANVLWLPREDAWVLIDFGCAARIGSRAPLTYSPTYAAPEVLHADELCAEVVEVFPEVDVWSLGVLAFEVLTGLKAPENVLNKAIASFNTEDRAPLPWEGALSHDVCQKLGPLQSIVLSMLQYDPSLRPTMDTFHSIVQSYVQ